MTSSIIGVNNNIYIENTYNKSLTYEDIIKNKILLTNKNVSTSISDIINELSSYTSSPIIQLVSNKKIRRIVSSPELSPINQLCPSKNFTRLVSVSPKLTNIKESPDISPINQLSPSKNLKILLPSPEKQLRSYKNISRRKLFYKNTSPKLFPMESPELSPIAHPLCSKNITSSSEYKIKPKKYYTLDNCNIDELVPDNYLIKKNRSMSCDSILNYYLYKPICIRWLYNKNIVVKN
jgi:hypothetical protein